MMEKKYFVYLLASKRRGTIYAGITNNILERVYQHKKNLVPGFTARYGVHRLVYYEETGDVLSAIQREKQIKKWNREWKIRLIEKDNPNWDDLFENWFDNKERRFPPARE